MNATEGDIGNGRHSQNPSHLCPELPDIVPSRLETSQGGAGGTVVLSGNIGGMTLSKNANAQATDDSGRRDCPLGHSRDVTNLPQKPTRKSKLRSRRRKREDSGLDLDPSEVIVDNDTVRHQTTNSTGVRILSTDSSTQGQVSHGVLPRNDNRTQTRKGMQNGGNYCYINAIVQLLLSFPNFVRKLNEFFVCNKEQDIPLTRAFISITATLVNGQEAASPRQLKDVVDKLTNHFLGTRQQDAVEFLECILNELHEEICRVQISAMPSCGFSQDVLDMSTFVTDCFQLRTQTLCKCGNCGKIR